MKKKSLITLSFGFILLLSPFLALKAAEKGDISFIKNELSNHEVEISNLKEQLTHQDMAFDTLQNNLQKDFTSLKNLLKENINLFEIELKKSSVKKCGEENTSIKPLQEEFKTVFSDYKKKLVEIEENVKIQDKKIQDIQQSLKKLLSCLEGDLDVKEEEKGNTSSTYKVKPGDSLEKIAKKEKISLSSLKEINNLKNDTILVGQVLKLKP